MIQEILVPLDSSELAEAAVPHARLLASAFKARVHLLSVVERPPGACSVDSVDWRLLRDEQSLYLDQRAAELRGAGLEVETACATGTASDQILDFVRCHGADLVVMTTHGRGGMSEFPLSGTVSKVISAAGVSVLVVRPRLGAAPEQEAVVSYPRILVPVDCSPRADWAVCLAAHVAESCDGELLLVTVVEPPVVLGSGHGRDDAAKLARGLSDHNRRAAESHLAELSRRLGPGVAVRTRTVESREVVAGLLQVARQEGCSLVVLCAHGEGGGGGWSYGSVPRGMLERSELPVLVFQDFEAAGAAVAGEPFRRAANG